MDDLPQEVADLEAKIENLSNAAEENRKIVIVAKTTIGAGSLLFTAMILGFIRSDAIFFVGGITAIIGGIAFYGSSKSTLDETNRKIDACEKKRAEIIDRMDIREVGVIEVE